MVLQYMLLLSLGCVSVSGTPLVIRPPQKDVADPCTHPRTGSDLKGDVT